jgi:hypothetical protein
VVQKVFSYGHIPQKWASKMNEFNSPFLKPHLNYHRPCFFPAIKAGAKGKKSPGVGVKMPPNLPNHYSQIVE